MNNNLILVSLRLNRNILAMMHVVREKESSQSIDAYTVLNGGEHFTDLSMHPNKIGAHGTSTAAGAYQAIFSTWEEERSRWGFNDFGMDNQDFFCIARFIYRKAISEIVTGRFIEAVFLCRKEWASLPGASQSNPNWTIGKAQNVYLHYGGLLLTL